MSSRHSKSPSPWPIVRPPGSFTLLILRQVTSLLPSVVSICPPVVCFDIYGWTEKSKLGGLSALERNEAGRLPRWNGGVDTGNRPGRANQPPPMFGV